jgi:hypothetical protein
MTTAWWVWDMDKASESEVVDVVEAEDTKKAAVEYAESLYPYLDEAVIGVAPATSEVIPEYAPTPGAMFRVCIRESITSFAEELPLEKAKCTYHEDTWGDHVEDPANEEPPNKIDDHLMVFFRVDIQKVRTSIRRTPMKQWIARVTRGNVPISVGPMDSPSKAIDLCLDWHNIGEEPFLQPHPWRRLDGSHIKAAWEEETAP